MSNLHFGIHIVALMIAISASYAILMSILKKEPNRSWLLGESFITFVASGIASVLYLMNFSNIDLLYILTALALMFGVVVSGIVVFLHHKFFQSIETASIHTTTRNLGILLFIVLVVSFVLEIVSLAHM